MAPSPKAVSTTNRQQTTLLQSSCACERCRIVVSYENEKDETSVSQRRMEYYGQQVVECHCPRCRKFHTSGCVRYFQIDNNTGAAETTETNAATATTTTIIPSFPLSVQLESLQIEDNDNDYDDDDEEESLAQFIRHYTKMNNNNDDDNAESAFLTIRDRCLHLEKEQHQNNKNRGPSTAAADSTTVEVDRLVCRYCSSKLATLVTTTKNTNQESSSSSSSQQQQQQRWLLNLGPMQEDSIPPVLAKAWRQAFVPASAAFKSTKSSTTSMDNNIQQNEWEHDSRASWLVDATHKGKQQKKKSQLMSFNNNNNDDDLVVTGGCACGSSRYRLTLPHSETEFQHCYCRLCRQFSGSAYQSWMPVEEDNLEWITTSKSTTTTDPPPLIRTTPHGQRHMCPQCRGVLTIVYDEQPGVVWPAAGGLDDADDTYDEVEQHHQQQQRQTLNDNLRLYRVCHICCRYRPPWYKLPTHDGLERLPEAG